MDEDVNDERCLTASLGLLSDYLELDTYGDHTLPSQLSLDQQAGIEELPETWNNGASVPNLPEPKCIDPLLLSCDGAGIDISTQVHPGQDVTGLGSDEGLQVAIETH